MVGAVLLLLDHLAPLLQLVFATGASLLQTLLERIDFGLQSLRLLRMVALLRRFLQPWVLGGDDTGKKWVSSVQTVQLFDEWQ